MDSTATRGSLRPRGAAGTRPGHTLRSSRRTEVLLVIRQRMVRDGVALLLRERNELRVAAVGTLDELARVRRSSSPPVLVVDLDDWTRDVAALRAVLDRLPDAAVIGLTGDPARARAWTAMLGLAGCFARTSPSSELAELVLVAASGATVAPAPGEARAERLERGIPGRLTLREVEVLQEIAGGHRTDDVAASLGISPLTVRSHMKAIMAKMDVHSAAEAVTLGFRLGVVRPGHSEQARPQDRADRPAIRRPS